MTEQEMLNKLREIPFGSLVFVSYTAGREPTDRAIRESKRSRREGINGRHFIGTLEVVRRTKKDEVIMVIKCDNREDERNGYPYGFRAFNPNVGTLLTLERIS